MKEEREEPVVISLKIPKTLFYELQIRIPERERSAFIREAIIEKLSRIPRPDKVLELEKRVEELGRDLGEIKKILADFELLTYKRGGIDVYRFCANSVDRKIIDYLLQHRGATTPELVKALGIRRWKILGRLKRIAYKSKKELGKAIIEFDAGEREGKRRAWWITLEE
jgi:hypothetical protein